MTTAFMGGEGLSSKLQEMMQKLGVTATTRVGFLEGATYDDGQSIAEVAFINEYGHSIPVGQSGQAGPMMAVPPRPFFRNAISQNSAQWGELLANALKTNDYDSTQAMGMTGLVIGGQIQASIMSDVGPPNAESTKLRKNFAGGASMTLRDTKDMLRAVSYQVESGEQVKVNEGAG